MKPYRQEAEQRLLREQAAHWLCELADGEPQALKSFAAWLKRSPEHVGEFLQVSAVWKEFGSVGRPRQADIEKAVSAALADEHSNVVALQAGAPATVPASTAPLKFRARLRERPWSLRLAAAIAVLAIGALGVTHWMTTRSPTYATAVGEQRSFQLPDGSLLQLNTRSRVKVRYSEQARDIHLLEGEALFTVERDTARPFQVDAGGVVIQALGTQFDVYRRATRVTVSVTKGAVRVFNTQTQHAASSTQLAAGEQAQVHVKGPVVKETAPDLSKALAWRERRLVFQDERLEDIIAEVNRYTPRPIRLQGAMARERKITGTFDADDPDSLLQFISRLDELVVERRDGGVVIKER